MKKQFVLTISLLITLLSPGLTAWAGPNEDLRKLYDEGSASEEQILKALNQGADPNQDLEGTWPLIWLADMGSLKIVQTLVEKGAKVDATDKPGQTALHVAAAAGQKQVVDYLLSKGAKVNATDHSGLTALHMAAAAGQIEVLDFLLSKGASLAAQDWSGKTALEEAAYNGESNIIAYLLARGGTVEPQERIRPLMWAAGGGELATVEYLLELGAQVNATDARGLTALMMAALGGYEVLDEDGFPFKLWQKHEQSPQIVRLLIDSGANLKAKTSDGNTVLMYAAYNGNLEVARLLLASGADVHARNAEGKSALSIATFSEHFDLCNLLIEQGARF